MAGRGRGRGRGSGLSFNLEALGVQRGEIVSNPGRQITLFPPLKFQPLPLEDVDDSLLELKAQLRLKFQQSPFFLTKEEKKRDIERYSDKYQNFQNEANKWLPDWTQFPEELRPKPKKKKLTPSALKTVKPNLSLAAKKNVEDVLSKLEDLEKTTPGEEEAAEEEQDAEDEEKEGEEQEGDEEDEFADEEETDYNLNYFDNGEGYGDEDDEDDEPTYS